MTFSSDFAASETAPWSRRLASAISSSSGSRRPRETAANHRMRDPAWSSRSTTCSANGTSISSTARAPARARIRAPRSPSTRPRKAPLPGFESPRASCGGGDLPVSHVGFATPVGHVSPLLGRLDENGMQRLHHARAKHHALRDMAAERRRKARPARRQPAVRDTRQGLRPRNPPPPRPNRRTVVVSFTSAT